MLALRAWEQRLDWFLSDRMMTPEREADLRAYQTQLGLSDAEIAGSLPKLFRAKQLTQISYGYLPTVTPGNVMLPKGEICHFASGSALYQEVHNRQYVSATTTSGPIRFGRARIGGTQRRHMGQWVETSSTQCIATGTFLITNNSVWFVSHSIITIPLTAIIGMNYYSNALELQYFGREERNFFSLADGELAAFTLHAARKVLENETDET